MTKVKIVTDSTCTMDPELIKKYDITVIPLSVMIDGVMYTVDEHFDNQKFMTQMAEASALPKTSQPPIGVFAEAFEKLTADGSEVLALHVTHNLSGTAESARQASHLVAGKVTVLDTDYIDQSLGFQVLTAAKLAQAGKSLAEILPEVEKVKQHSQLFIGISTLENLVKGGRVSKVAGLVTNLLNIKLIFELKENGLQPVAKGRGKKVFTKWLKELIQTLEKETIEKLGISYAGDVSLAEELKAELQTAFPHLTIPIFHTNSIVATHAGAGAFAIMYYTKD